MNMKKDGQSLKNSLVFAQNTRIAIIIADFYPHITDDLLHGAVDYCQKHKIQYDVVNVKGALEIPIAMGILMGRDLYDGFLALGCIIRGETYHFEIVAGESARAIMDFAMAYSMPVANAILTVENMAQAQERADPKAMNKGYEAMDALGHLLKLNEYDA